MIKISKEMTPFIVERIELLIAKQGMKKAEFYKKSGISSALYSQWNTVAHCPSLVKLQGAADALGVDLADLIPNLEESEQKNKPATENGDELSEAEVRVVKLLRQIPRGSREAAYRAVESVLFALLPDRRDE